MAYDYDLFVIGGGSGGVRAARFTGPLGFRVGLAEEYRMGGTCVIRGCVPKKLLSYAAHGFEDVADLAGYGYDIAVKGFSWETLIAAKDKDIDRLEKAYQNTLTKNGVETFKARARLVDAHTVALRDTDTGEERTVTADKILLATGGRPTVPDMPGSEHAITSNEAFHLPSLPKQVVVYGGGYIAVEFASIFAGLGAETHLIYRGQQPLRGFDEDVRHFFLEQLDHLKNLTLHMGETITSLSRSDADGVLTVALASGASLQVEQAMFATGRTPNTPADLCLDGQIELTGKGAVKIDAFGQTTVPNIYAVGDVTDRVQLTPVALHEAMAFVKTVFQDTPTSMDHSNVATAVFANPEIAVCGLTEAEARAQYADIDVYQSSFRPMKNTLSGNPARSFMKLIVDRDSDRVLGMHMVGRDSAEMMQGFAVAIKMGAKKADFDATVGIHPTSAEEMVTMRKPV
ncbi:MAG: glutathione-disulfide reductase [Alphaproteobacteria bacterium TMED89]|nr:glutathione-disulfide reductase [Rhodospirillaceae bacterium]RPH15399.1 MAG: glutathione-disulfide reductase [Alphaproteobacteria bacterium TMED89]